MPKLTIAAPAFVDKATGDTVQPAPKVVTVEAGTRLVLAIRDAGVEIGHRCGGHAKCTTCRVEVTAGEPERITEAEKAKLDAAELEGIRLACQLNVDHDMSVKALMTVGDQPWEDPGPEPAAEIEPEPVWTDR